MKKNMEEEIRAQLEANMANMANISSSETWEERLKQAQEDIRDDDQYKNADRRKHEPHFVNLNEDPMLSNVIFHYIKAGESTVGRQGDVAQPDICLSGLSILKQHAILSSVNGMIDLKPAEHGAKIKINGQPVTGTHTLVNKDRVLFGKLVYWCILIRNGFSLCCNHVL